MRNQPSDAPAAPVQGIPLLGVLVLIAGIAGKILHIGLFFVPALVVLTIGTLKLWREQS